MADPRLERFTESWRPLIRPPGLEEALVETYRLKPRSDAMRSSPALVGDLDLMWLREFKAALRRHPEVKARLEEEDYAEVKSIFDTHRKILKLNRFDRDYLDSIERVALFFIFHELKSSWVIGCYDEMKDRLFDALDGSAAVAHAMNPLAAQKALSTIAMIDCTQIHRVYNYFDRQMVSNGEWRRLGTVDYGMRPEQMAAQPQRAFGGMARQ